MVRVKPEQYLWVHRRFKTRPVGEQGFYRKKK
jgi:KDO2-lipid IV(A) lauroyltransferase